MFSGSFKAQYIVSSTARLLYLDTTVSSVNVPRASHNSWITPKIDRFYYGASVAHHFVNSCWLLLSRANVHNGQE